MRDLITDFLQSAHIDPVYFVTCAVDVIAFILWKKLKTGLSVTQRSFYNAFIFVSVVLTIVVLCKVFGVIKDWSELRSIWHIAARELLSWY